MADTTCVICGAPLTGRKTRFCSQACAIKGNTIDRRQKPERWAAHLAQHDAWQKANREKANSYKAYETRVCEWCGSEFRTRADGPSRFCSTACAGHGREGSREGASCFAAWRACPVCGVQHLVKNPHRADDACSSWCRTILTTGVGPKSRLRFGYCQVCGKPYRVYREGDKPNKQGSRFTSACSHECRAVLTYGTIEERTPRHWAISPQRRLRIYERDNWTCQICGEPVDKDADPQRSDWYPTLDHIVPRSQGGSDADSNLRCAHRWCNSVRGDLRYHDDSVLRLPA